LKSALSFVFYDILT